MKIHNCRGFPITVYGGMFNHPAYLLQFAEENEEQALYFDGQSSSHHSIGFESGVYDPKSGFSLMPGTLIIKEAGIYALDYTLCLAAGEDMECRVSVYADGSLLLNSMSVQQLSANTPMMFSRRTYYPLNADAHLQLILHTKKAGLLMVGAKMSELLAEKLADL